MDDNDLENTANMMAMFAEKIAHTTSAQACMVILVCEANLILGTQKSVAPETVERLLSQTLACVRASNEKGDKK